MLSQVTLQPDEQIELVLKRSKNIPFRKKDLLNLLVIVINLVCIGLILKINLFEIIFIPSHLVFIFIFLINTVSLCNLGIYYYKRYLNAFKSTLVLTNKRLIYIDHTNTALYHLYFSNFPTISYKSNQKGDGYLILGKKQSLISTFTFFIYLGKKVNSTDNDLIFFNIAQVQTVFNLLQVKVLQAKNYN